MGPPRHRVLHRANARRFSASTSTRQWGQICKWSLTRSRTRAETSLGAKLTIVSGEGHSKGASFGSELCRGTSVLGPSGNGPETRGHSCMCFVLRIDWVLLMAI